MQTIVVGLAGAVVFALTVHVFMLAGTAGNYAMHADDTGGKTEATGVSAAPAPRDARDSRGHRMIAGCVAVLATLGLVVLLRKVAKTSAAGRAVAAAPSAPPTPRTARCLPPPVGPLVAAGVLLRV